MEYCILFFLVEILKYPPDCIAVELRYLCMFEMNVFCLWSVLSCWGEMESVVTSAQQLWWRLRGFFLARLDQRAGLQVVFHFSVWWDEVQLF